MVNDNFLIVLNNYLGYGGQRTGTSVRHQGAGRPARKGSAMGDPVVHFEITGTDPQLLRRYYGELFGWKFDTSGPVSPAVSEPGNYGFTDGNTTSGGTGIPGGVGGGSGYPGHAIFYVGVPDVEAALQKAESLGGTRRLGPEQNPGTNLVIGHFTDPEGHLIGLASAV
jgi:predicted enzyme related to lactoylglutathione lyase